MASKEEVAVFAATNLGTRIAVAVSQDITAGDFKRELEKTHLSCFPNFGEIRVYGLMVKRKSCFYHLPESVPIKNAFQGLKGTRFLCAEVTLLNGSLRLGFSKHVAAEVEGHVFNGKGVTNSPVTSNERKDELGDDKESKIKVFHRIKPLQQELPKAYSLCGKKKKMKMKRLKNLETVHEIEKGCPNINEEIPSVATKENFSLFVHENEVKSAIECHSNPVVQTPSERSSEVIPAAGVINRYLSDFSEVSRCGSPSTSYVASRIQSQLQQQRKVTRDYYCSGIEVDVSPGFTVRTHPRELHFSSFTDPKPGPSRNKPREDGVGKRLLRASNNLRMSGNKQKPAISVWRSKKRKFVGPNAASLVKYLVFEISGSDD